MGDILIDAKNRRMLELLALGSTSRVIARQMGYRDGTMRVYLHNLYRRIGVANKTEAVVWYLSREKPLDTSPTLLSTAHADAGDLFGDMALEQDLYAALGVMSHFVGPYGRIWEVGLRLAGTEPDAKVLERRARARLLFRALLSGDWALGKRLFDTGHGPSLLLDAPSDAVLLVGLLLCGGYSHAADRLAARLTDKRKNTPGATPREASLIGALRNALYADGNLALATIQRLAAEKHTPDTLRQVAMVLLFHACKARGDLSRARQVANGIWDEAEAARKHLQAMGEPTVGGRAVPAKSGARVKAAAIR